MSRLSQLFLDHVAQTSPSPIGLEINRAEGIYLYGADGKRYVDLISGVSVSNVGHSNRYVVDAVCCQTQQYMHLMVYGELIQSPQVLFAKLLADNLPDSLNSVYFVNSGSEAIEGALKLAKRYTGRTGLVCFENAYHGSSHGALSIMGNEFFRNSFRPLLPDVTRLRYNETGDFNRITNSTAAVVVEPIQGEAGFILPKSGFLQALRNRCTEVGAMLIFDEIQTGFGRTGSLYAFQKYGVVPDILVTAKAFGGGMPLGAFISSSQILCSLTSNPVLGHITTFGGHPVCCAAGKAALEYILQNRLMETIEERSRIFEERLRHFPVVKEIRRDGLLIAIDFGEEDLCAQILKKAVKNGLLTEGFLFNERSMRIAPPLTITMEEIHQVCDVLETIFR